MPIPRRPSSQPSACRRSGRGAWRGGLALVCALFSGLAKATVAPAVAAQLGVVGAASATPAVPSTAFDGRYLRAQTQPSGLTRWQWAPPGQPPRVWQVPRDRHVPSDAAVLSVQVLASTDRWLLVRDSYPSRLNQGQGACGAGEEVFLRVLRLQPPKQMLQLKLASCWQNLALDPSAPGDGVAWDAASQTLRVRWLTGPAGHGGGQRQWLLQPDGDVLPR